MYDIILRIVRIFIWLWLILYSLYFYISNIIITNYKDYNVYFILIIFLIGLMIFFMWIIMPCIKKAKVLQFIFWLFLLYFWHYFLINNINSYVFISDVLKILWVFLLIAWPMGRCIPKKCIKKEIESKIKIIEV